MQRNLLAVDFTLACQPPISSGGKPPVNPLIPQRFIQAMTTELLTERRDSTLVITLSGPATRNLLSAQVIAAGIETLNMAESNPDVSAVIITGASGQFCAGSDEHASHLAPGDLASQSAQIDAFNQWIDAIRSFPKPVIAAVEGLAAGRGLALVLACDVVIAADTARFCVHAPHATAVPEGGLSHTLERTLGRGRALQVLWRRTPVSAAEWSDWGLVQQVAPTGHALSEALQLATDVAALPSNIVSSIKELVNDANQNSWRTQLTLEKQHALILMAKGHSAP